MKFLDEVTIDVCSGRGGDGMVHFRREKFVPRGGPDGGDGGRGGDVVLRVDPGCNTLLHLRFNPSHRAENGQPGGTSNRTGRRGEDVEIRVPQGTTVRTIGEELVLADLTAADDRVVVAAGGEGGKGNAHFRSATNRTPQQSSEGGPAVRLRLALELRLLADVGLVGLPNAGKSTLLSRVSAARPRVADYPFTTLEPSLGMVRHGAYGSFAMADLPGLIEGASDGHGLGHRFLRHVERTAVFLYLVSVEPGAEPADPLARFRTVYDEVCAYQNTLGERPAVLGLSKIDTRTDREQLGAQVAQLRLATGLEAIPFSAVTGEGLERLIRTLGEHVERARGAGG